MPGVTYGRRGGGSAVDLDSSSLMNAIAKLTEAGAEVQAQTTPLLAEILVSAVHEVFVREGAVAGRSRWPDLAESTKENRLQKLRGGRKLRGGGGTYLEGGQWYTETAKERRARIKRQGRAREKRRQREASIVFTILQDTGNLAGSIMPYADGEVAEAFTNVPYAGYHISDAPRKKIPKRDFTDIDFETAQAEAVDVILAQFIASAAE
jgi:phage gpG-like protein